MSPAPPKHIVAACALTTNSAGEILLVKTERRGWEVPGGQVEEGESLIQTAIRETQEEAGVTIAIGDLCVVNSNLSRSIVVFGFRGRYLSGQAAADNETLDAQWVAPQAALTMITHPVNLQRTRDLLAFDGQVLYRAYTVNPYRLVETDASSQGFQI